AEGGASRVVAPADDEDVLLRDTEARIGPLRFDEAPTHGLADVDAGVQIIGGPFDRAVAGEDVIDLEIAQLRQTSENVAGAEVDAARIAEHAARHDEIAERDELLTGLLEVPGHRAIGVAGDAQGADLQAGEVEIGVFGDAEVRRDRRMQAVA